MKIKNENNDGDSRKTSPEAWEFFQKIKEFQIESGQLATHPESHFLRKHSWEGMITIRFESDSYALDNNDAEFRRDDLIYTFMDNLIRYKWKYRHKNIFWVATTEFGKSGVAHCHIIFTFLPAIRKGKTIPDVSDFKEVARESLDHVCKLCGCPKTSVDLDWQTKFDDIGLVSYFAKKEPGRDYKHFIYSTDGVKWIQEILDMAKERKEDNQ
jgi:hypothetical protein